VTDLDATSKPDDQPAEQPVLRGARVTFPPRRWLLPTFAVLLTLGLVIGIGGYRLYVHPSVDVIKPGERVDAVVALGGLIATANYAQTLVQQGAAPVLVVSNPYDDGIAPVVERMCSGVQPDEYRVICFKPDPSTTRGEARAIQALAQQNGWTRVAVVAPSFHISRARLIFERCYPGTLLMVELPQGFAWYNWTYQFTRQTAGFVKTAVWRGC
jgi:hypothetical protein